jgi:hypothetical protein
MKTPTILFLALCVYTLHCAAQQPKEKSTFLICPSDTVSHIFVGYCNKQPVFRPYKASRDLYVLSRYSEDSLTLKYLRHGKFDFLTNTIYLAWVSNEIEVYVSIGNETKHTNFIIVRNNKIDTLPIPFNSFYDDNTEPFLWLEEQNTFIVVQPEIYEDEYRRRYYDSIMMINLQEPELTIKKLPVTAIQVQRVEDYLYYKGGGGDLEDALLRVKLMEWDKVDTLLNHVGFWFVKDNILYAETGGYAGQDEWIDVHGSDVFVAYSIASGQCAVIPSTYSPQLAADRQPVLFEGVFYTFFSCYVNKCRSQLDKIELPTITDFPYKQTLIPKRNK